MLVLRECTHREIGSDKTLSSRSRRGSIAHNLHMMSSNGKTIDDDFADHLSTYSDESRFTPAVTSENPHESDREDDMHSVFSAMETMVRYFDLWYSRFVLSLC
jgi:hypothetical protein